MCHWKGDGRTDSGHQVHSMGHSLFLYIEHCLLYKSLGTVGLSASCIKVGGFFTSEQCNDEAQQQKLMIMQFTQSTPDGSKFYVTISPSMLYNPKDAPLCNHAVPLLCATGAATMLHCPPDPHQVSLTLSNFCTGLTTLLSSASLLPSWPSSP